MTDEFDIDIYGDLNPDEPAAQPTFKKEQEEFLADENQKNARVDIKAELPAEEDTNMAHAAPDGDNSGSTIVKEEPMGQQKQKRKLDDRPYDAGATSALYIADLHWWTTDDDIRGWVNQCDCEDELKDITFSEHKVNGKSKGFVIMEVFRCVRTDYFSVAFVEFTSPQAASAVKSKIESGTGQPSYMGKRHTVNYTNPSTNPFRTLPKDAPQRDRSRDGFQSGRGMSDRSVHSPPVGMTPSAGIGMGSGMSIGNGFRSNRGGFAGPGRGNISGGFIGSRGGFAATIGGPQSSPQPAFQTPMTGAFGGPNMPMQQFGGGNFQGGGFPSHRGGIGSMRGSPAMRGRGNMGPNSMMGGAMGGMGGNMGAGMGMGGSMGGMGGNMGQMTAGAGNMDGGFNPMGGMGGFNMGGMGVYRVRPPCIC